MGQSSKVLLFLIITFAGSVQAQSLCNISRIVATNEKSDEVGVSFHGRNNAKIQVVSDEGSAEFELKSGALKSGTKAVNSIITKKNARYYIVDGLTRSCILHPGEQEGRQGFYIEEYQHVHGEPPIFKSEFVESN